MPRSEWMGSQCLQPAIQLLRDSFCISAELRSNGLPQDVVLVVALFGEWMRQWDNLGSGHMVVVERRNHFNSEYLLEVSVDAARFIELLISRRSMVRVDTPDLGQRGLIDCEEGVLYTAPERELRQRAH